MLLDQEVLGSFSSEERGLGGGGGKILSQICLKSKSQEKADLLPLACKT